MKSSLKGAVIASAVASLFATGAAFAADKAPKKEQAKMVKCEGGNACAGKSGCATAKSSCAGQNSCKGQGWTMEKSAKDCTAKGGKIAKK
jgi:uncharacterized membrane protein